MLLIGSILIIIIFFFLLYIGFTDYYIEITYNYNKYLNDLWGEYDDGFLSIEQVRSRIKDCITEKINYEK